MHVIHYTNISVIETDGPYGGYTCSSTKHKYHEDREDSVYWQNKLQGAFYHTLQVRIKKGKN